jgi:hypothetical protein
MYSILQLACPNTTAYLSIAYDLGVIDHFGIVEFVSSKSLGFGIANSSMSINNKTSICFEFVTSPNKNAPLTHLDLS